MEKTQVLLYLMKNGDKHMQKFKRFVGVPTRVLITMPLIMAMLLPGFSIAQTYETEKLEVDFIEAYDEIWKDSGSGAKLDVSIWRPTPPANWHRIGHHIKQGHGFPTEPTMIVKGKTSGILAKPINYIEIWKDSGSDADRDVSVWRPVCPSKYRALGDVANGNYGPPSFDEVRCIHESALVKALPGGFIWNDSGSGAHRDFGAWGIQASAADSTYTYLSRGLFYGATSHSRPSIGELWAVKMKQTNDARRAQLMSDDLLFDYTQVFERVWDDKGSGAHRNVSFFKPVPRDGYYALGHYAHASHAMPHDIVIVVKEKKPGALIAPLNYEKIWTDSGSGANSDGAVWWPSCPSNYVALGLVTTSGAKPPLDAVRCVRQDLTAQAEVGDQIWNDGGSGAKQNFAAWRIKASSAPAGEAYVSPGTFIGHAFHSTIENANARTLKMTLPFFPSTIGLSAPELSGYGKPSDSENQTITSEVYLPFSAVKDNAWSPAKMAKDSPYYKLVRTDQFKLINHIYNKTSTAQSVKWAYSTALENSESFSHEAGISLTTGYDNKPAGVGYSVSATLHYSFTYQKTQSETKITTINVPATAPPNTAVVAYMVHSQFQLYRADGSKVGVEATANKPNSFVFVEYPRQDKRVDQADYKRTVVFIYGKTFSGQDMFIRGGIDHDYANSKLNKNCSTSNYNCAIPIRHLNLKNTTTNPWKMGDAYLDWYGKESGQNEKLHGLFATGTPLDWTTNQWPAADWGEKRTVAVHGFGEESLNEYGPHYWMLDIEMDCSKTVAGWFELKSYISNGPQWEGDIKQSGTPYSSNNHFGKCGYVNVFKRNHNEPVTILE